MEATPKQPNGQSYYMSRHVVQESPADAVKPARRKKHAKIAPIRRVSFHFTEFHFPEFHSSRPRPI